MDLKWKCVGALKTLFIQYTNMYNNLSIVVLPLILICFCFYLFLLFKSNFLISHSTSIEFNIIDKFKDVSHMKVHNNLSENSVQNNTHVNLVNGKKKKYHVPKFMLELYEKNKGVARHEVGPDVVRGLIPTHAGPLQNNEIIEELSNNHLLVFDLPSLDKDELFVGAELKILTQLNVSSTDFNSGAKRIIKISVYDDLTKEFLFIRETEIHHYNNTWLSFNLTFPVSKILHSDYQNKYLKVIITLSSFMHHFKNKNNNKLKLSLMPEFENFEHDYPILLLSYSSTSDTKQMLRNISDEEIKRSKRNIEDDYEEETNKLWDEEFGSGKKVPKKLLKRMRNTCKKKPLYINFSEIEYDIWIVQPSGYEAYQCQGRCFFPVAEHLNPTKHAIMQALVHSVFPSRASRSCCVPTVLDSISILYVDEKGVLTYRYSYKDMVVIECGCR